MRWDPQPDKTQPDQRSAGAFRERRSGYTIKLATGTNPACVPDLAPELGDVVDRPPPQTRLRIRLRAKGDAIFKRDVILEGVHLCRFRCRVSPKLAADQGLLGGGGDAIGFVVRWHYEDVKADASK